MKYHYEYWGLVMCGNKNHKLSMLLVIFALSATVLAIPTADARGAGQHAGSGSHSGGHGGHISGHKGNHAGHRHFGGNHRHSSGNHKHFGGLRNHTGHHAGSGAHGGGYKGHIRGHKRNHAGHRHFGGIQRYFGENQKHFGGKRSHNGGISRHNSRHNYNYHRYGYSFTPSNSFRSYSPYQPRHYSPRSYSTNTPSYSSPTPYISIKTYPPSFSSDANTNNNSAGTRNIEKDKAIKVINNAEVSLLTTDVEWNMVSACLSNKKSCNCYGYSGDRLAISKENCELAAKYGWPQKPKNRT